MTLVKNTFVFTASVIAIVACSSGGAKKGAGTDQNDTEGSDTTDAPLTDDERLCDELYKSQLAWVGRCGGFLSDAPSALTRYRKLCARELVAPGADDLREARSTCAARRNDAACDAIVKECELPPGKLPDGAACGVRAQCASRFCKIDAGACGTCAPLVKAGEACTNPTDCAYGENEVASCEYPDDKATAGKCVVWKLVGVGAACGVDSFCQPDAHCEWERQDGPGKCVKNAEKGAACTDATSCRPGLACIDKKCADRVGEGEACSNYDDCGAGLACGQTCQKPTMVNSGQECGALRHCSRGVCFQKQGQGENGQAVAAEPPMCVAPISDGEACGPNSDGLVCDYFSRCSAGKCVFPDPSQCK